ncbi:MAG: hypothetical protein ACRDKE_09550 [Solirubrobacterales bacterium]
MALNRKQWLWILGIATALWFAAFAIPEHTMTNTGGPGVPKFEMVRTAEHAAQYMSEWGESGINAAKWALWMDFPFILLFASFLSLLMRAAADRCRDQGRAILERIGRKTWWTPIVVGCFDAIEDVGLLAILYGNTGSLAPAIATGFAIAKFTLLALVFAYLTAVLVATRLRRQTSAPSSR